MAYEKRSGGMGILTRARLLEASDCTNGDDMNFAVRDMSLDYGHKYR